MTFGEDGNLGKERGIGAWSMVYKDKWFGRRNRIGERYESGLKTERGGKRSRTDLEDGQGLGFRGRD